jgi:hypothetical protein
MQKFNVYRIFSVAEPTFVALAIIVAQKDEALSGGPRASEEMHMEDVPTEDVD